MKVGLIKETAVGERRVALVPETVKKLSAKGFAVTIESTAGQAAGFPDTEYVAAGATVGSRVDALRSDVVLGVVAPRLLDLSAMTAGATVAGLLAPTTNCELVSAIAAQGLGAIALELIPRTSLAQSMDVLSSQANLAGYWAVVAAATRLPKVFPLLMTAAGTITPARVLVMGVGVAGLQAIGTARRLGAIVEATDVRPETKEQVESLGAKFLIVDGATVTAGTGGYAAEQSDEYKRKQAELIDCAISRADVVITTAQIPGRRAPRLVTDAQLATMRHGSVVVDLAAESGGNVEGSKPGVVHIRHGVTLVGARSAPSEVAFHASQAFSRNLEKLLLHLAPTGSWREQLDDDIAKGCMIIRGGEVLHPQVRVACPILEVAA
ncbi:MAG: Re/Si-specific NAD(P)(+) transhydrogenase subunit alpha [Deltaproteobacteria bacterium]|nr:Re/Si-specific NAD(P)(+) transhydrogenase subunit alpha [Deltaproteobacteria bacterium]MDQ3296145.1 Re/Si-specific NAD(P)(+) transhydrogenase subunit alpha [Myxococcota bacterium]